MSGCTQSVGRTDPAALISSESWFALWAAVIPMTTFLVVPAIQGTTPAYLMALCVLPLCALSLHGIVLLGSVFAGWFIFYFLSQFGLSAGGVQSFEQLNLVEPNDRNVVFRRTTVTQTLYFVACIATFTFTRLYFRERWMRFVFFGAWALVVYGLYEWAFYALFGTSGDFLANREFQSGSSTHTGSWSQAVQVGPLTLLRLKSFTGEPSFFALVAVPYLALAVGYGRRILASALLLALILSFSTSAYLGILVVALSVMWQRRAIDRRVLVALLVGFVGIAILVVAFPATFSAMFTEKFAGENESGAIRYFHMTYPFTYFAQLPLLNQLFGIGFGTSYLAGTLRVMLDLGLVGLGIYLALFLRPVIRLSQSSQNIGWTSALISLLFLYTVSAAELFYPTTWLILGIASWRLDAEGVGAIQRHLHRPSSRVARSQSGGPRATGQGTSTSWRKRHVRT